MGFEGLKVLSLESRRAADMATLITRFGGVPFIAPSVAERAVDDATEAIRFVEQLEAGEFEMVICMTGVGLAFLRDSVAPHMSVERLGAALRNTTILSRGPKPVPILRALNVPVGIMITEPNTWKEIVDAVANRPERRIAVQEYGRPNEEMNRALTALGAQLTAFANYRWELPADIGPLQEAARGLADRRYDVVLFTSSIQLDHLFEIARDLGIDSEVSASLKEHTAIASVGPVMTASLEAAGYPPDIIPQIPKMGALVKAASEQALQIIRAKRAASSHRTPPTRISSNNNPHP